jgi:hypothetical protein
MLEGAKLPVGWDEIKLRYDCELRHPEVSSSQRPGSSVDAATATNVITD